MTSFLFSDTPAKVYLHLLPQKTNAISYTYTPDVLTLSAHMEDNFAQVDQVDPRNRSIYDQFYRDNCYSCRYEKSGRCESVRNYGVNSDTVCPRGFKFEEEEKVTFDVSPAIFHCPLRLSDTKRFQRISNSTKVYLQASKVNDKRIKLSKTRKPLANTWSSNNVICWGRNSAPKSLRGMVDLFFNSPFNNDLVSIQEFVTNSKVVKEDLEKDNFFRTYSRYKFIAEKADALLMLHAEDNVQAFFWMLSAGFKTISEASHLMLIPLKETVLEHEGISYPGFLTPSDACNKEWFVTKSGDLIGQL